MLLNGKDYLPVHDFDGTIADTFKKSPRGVDVSVAYARACEDLFGVRNLLKNVGGVQNRTPIEIIAAIAAHREGALSVAWRFYTENHASLSSLVPDGASRLPKITVRNMHQALAEALVRLKLAYLREEIGPEWPKPCAGVLDHLRNLKAQGYPVIVMSSGHEPFINRCFQEYDLPKPDLVLSDDDVRWTALPPEKKSKPSRVLLHFLKDKAKRSGVTLPEYIAYAGDSEEKDGGFARNIDAPFLWFNPGESSAVRPLRPEDRSFKDWRELYA